MAALREIAMNPNFSGIRTQAHNPKVARCAQVLPLLLFANHSLKSYGFCFSPKDSGSQKSQNLTLLDSCVRASEFCAFRIGDFDPKRGKLEIRHGSGGGAKGGKGRTVYLGKTARHALWRYVAEREDGEELNVPLFVVREGRPFNPSSLRHIIKSIAIRTGCLSRVDCFGFWPKIFIYLLCLFGYL
jgi:hypothetical protein